MSDSRFVARVRLPDGTFGTTKSCTLEELVEAVFSTLPADLVYQVLSLPDGKIELKEVGHIGVAFKPKGTEHGRVERHHTEADNKVGAGSSDGSTQPSGLESPVLDKSDQGGASGEHQQGSSGSNGRRRKKVE